jgi:hypothetical protein
MNPNSRALSPLKLRLITNRPRLVAGQDEAFPGDFFTHTYRRAHSAEKLIANLRNALRDADRESLERPYCLGCGSHTDDDLHKADCLIYNPDGSAK